MPLPPRSLGGMQRWLQHSAAWLQQALQQEQQGGNAGGGGGEVGRAPPGGGAWGAAQQQRLVHSVGAGAQLLHAHSRQLVRLDAELVMDTAQVGRTPLACCAGDAPRLLLRVTCSALCAGWGLRAKTTTTQNVVVGTRRADSCRTGSRGGGRDTPAPRQIFTLAAPPWCTRPAVPCHAQLLSLAMKLLEQRPECVDAEHRAALQPYLDLVLASTQLRLLFDGRVVGRPQTGATAAAAAGHDRFLGAAAAREDGEDGEEQEEEDGGADGEADDAGGLDELETNDARATAHASPADSHQRAA